MTIRNETDLQSARCRSNGGLMVMMKFLAALAIWPFAAIWRGYVITHLWRWFVEPFGIQSITIAWAVGLSLFVSFLTHHAREGEENSLTFSVVHAALTPAMILGFGYVIAQFMP